jgi:hypothetical protein
MHFFHVPTGTQVEAFGDSATWILIIIMGMLFTLGAFGFVRAFDDPPKPPLFTWRHVNTDELLGAWLTFLACIPAILYCLVFLYYDNRNYFYWGAFIGTMFFTIAALFFVLACYEVNGIYFLKVLCQCSFH